MNTNIPLMREGWVCPVCGNVNAPWVAACPCNGRPKSTYTTSYHTTLYEDENIGSGELYPGEFDNR